VALVVGPAAAVVAQQARALQLGTIPVLIVAAAVAAGVAVLAARLRPSAFLGEHGTWAVGQGLQLLRRGPRRRAKTAAPSEELAPVGEATSK
jgi:hypothetical protein